jgi:7-cyano-7-deazaguanine reductase
MAENPLGGNSPYPDKYDPGILYPIPRWPARSLLDIDKKILMYGIDHWHAYEISWLAEDGKPQVALGEFFFSSESENIVESKSLKLYLHSLNQERYPSAEAVTKLISKDLSAISRSEVMVVLHALRHVGASPPASHMAKSIDRHKITAIGDQPDPTLLEIEDQIVFDDELRSDLFRSNCPVTGQPDWASFDIQYTGAKINEASLLSYLCSYREHQGYHEECAERIYRDILQACRPEEMRVALNFLRRGGLDINVYRSTQPLLSKSVNPRLARQ